MPELSESTANIEQKVTTVPVVGDPKATSAEIDDIFGATPEAFEQKRKPVPQAASDTDGGDEAPASRKEHTPPTDEQKKELERDLLEDDKPAKKAPEKKEEELVVKRGEGGKFVKVEKREEKAEEKKEDKTDKTDKKEKKAFEDLSDEGINREVESLKTNKAETKERYASLLRELKAAREADQLTKKEYEKAKQEVTEAKKAAEDAAKKAVEPEDVVKQRKEQQEELAMLRRQYVLDHDPELKKKYDDQIEGAEVAITKTLTDAGVNEATIKLIQKSGGWTAFSKSRAPISWTEYNENNEPVQKRGTQAEYAATIMRILDPADSASIQARMGHQVLLKDQKDSFIQEEKKKAGEFFQQMEKKAKEQNEAATAQVKKLIDDYVAWSEEIVNTADFLKDEKVPENATKEQKEEIEQANKDRADIREYIKKQKQTTSLSDYQDLVIHAARGMASERLSKTADERIAALEKAIAEKDAELEKVRSAGRSVPATKSLGGGSAAPEKTKKNLQEVTADDILGDLDKLREEKA